MSIILQNVYRWSSCRAQLMSKSQILYEYSTLLTTRPDPIKIFANLNSYKRTGGKSYKTNAYRSEQSYENDVKTGSFLEEEHSMDLKPKTSYHLAYDQELLLTQQLEKVLLKVDQLKNEDWIHIKTKVLEKKAGINETNIDAITISKCSDLNSLSLGKSYFKFLRSQPSKLNRAVYGNYLRLFYDCSSKCTKKDCLEIIKVYEELVGTYSMLDSYTAEKAILALSITERWKEYKKLFKTIEMFYNPTSQVYSAVVKAAFRNKDINLGWELLEEAQYRRIVVHDEVYMFWISEVSNESMSTDEKLTKVLNFFNNFNIKPSVNLTEVIKQSFEKSDQNRMGIFTGVSRRGECNNCHSKLESAWVSQEDFDELRSAFLNPVLVGKDIFLKTQPEEMKGFLSFLDKHGPFDIVLDGLNIALKAHDNNKTPALFAFQLKSVVKHFLHSGERLLVLGRKHMNKWPKNEMKFIYDNTDVFFAENISQDDPFLLYATLHSGLGTRFVSQDLMRGHKFLLADPKLQATFQRWQAQHQYFLAHIESNGTVHIKEPIRFLQCIQQNSEGGWHIPYMVRENVYSNRPVDNFHRQWLCLVSNTSQARNGNYKNLTRSSRIPPTTYNQRGKSKVILDLEDLKK